LSPRKVLVAVVATLGVALYVPIAAPVQANSVPALDHVFLIVMENQSYGSIIGSSSAPYINSLLPSASLASNYFGITHPSLPNYLSLTGGSTFGITSDCTTCWISARNVADNVEAAGKTWRAYEESMPSACFVGDSYPYAQKHDPFIYFNDIRTNTSRCQSHVLPYTQMATDLQSTATAPNFAFITPNMCDDMHDCSIQQGDAWLKSQVPTILSSPAFTTQNSLLAITWDEDDFSGTNQVATLFLGSNVAHATASATSYNHYSLLRTIEAGLGLATLTTNDAGAVAMADMFGAPPPPQIPVVSAVAPATGSTVGGTSVTVTGTALSGVTSVSFGGTPATNVTRISDTQVTAVSPAHAQGGVDVTVTSSSGTSAVTAGDQFTYVTPASQAACSTDQYLLTGSDGATWRQVDGTKLSLNFTPSTSSLAILGGNADLWTSTSGYNQDLGIAVNGTLVGWKESGGSAGTFSPNAAYVQAALPVVAGQVYTASLTWKASRSDPFTIAAGAGPIGGRYSTTCLDMRFLPTTDSSLSSTLQHSLSNSDGSTWQPIDATLNTTVAPTTNGTEVLAANADLWTAASGFNQDLGIFVSVDGGADQLVGWKESGGSAGTFSPNAAYLESTYPLISGNTYVFKLEWKTNRNASGATIYAGAGPISGQYSPTRLTAFFRPAVSTGVIQTQAQLLGSDGSSWQAVDPSLRVSFTPSITGSYAISGNADLWTENSGFNQDVGVFITGGVYATPTLVAWKESGGSAGTFSPNAAYVETVLNLQASSSYTIWLQWKTNQPAAGTTIVTGAGPLPNSASFSPTRLAVIPL
jgi:hypothetical protein